MIDVFQFLSGAAMLGAWVGGVLLLRFWSRTRDRLFLMFGVAFWLMALERLVLALANSPTRSESHSLVYLIRLAAFLLILFAIVDKNRKGER